MKEELRNEILDGLRSQKGTVGFWFEDMVTGEELGYRENEQFPAASVIKLPMFMYLSKLDAEGKISMDEKIQTKPEDRVPICGALTLFTNEPECDIRTLCNLMISLSDNMATNILIDRLGIEEYARGFREMGLQGTVLERKLYDTAGEKKGLRNKIVPKEMGMLLKEIYERSFVNPRVSEDIENTLCLQQINHKICGGLSEYYRIAHKTGEDDYLSNDVGLIYAKEPFVVCYAGYDVDVYRWEDFIRRTTRDLVEECNI